MSHDTIHANQRGVSLIEALIALLVLTIGMVGLGALMLTSLQNVHSSAHYSVASAVVLDFEERLWDSLATTTVTNLPGLQDDDPDWCLSDDVIDDLAEEVTTEWGTDPDGDAPRFNVPGLTLAAGDTTTTEAMDGDGNPTGVHWKTIPVTLTWDEARFDDEKAEADRGSETYAANITIVCRPTFL